MRTWLALPIGFPAALALAACSGSGDSTGPDNVATIEVTLPAGILIGDTVTAVVVLRNAAGSVLTGRSVTFASSLGTTAAVNGAGLVTGVVAGGPVTITATSEGKSGTASTTVRDDQRFGYAWANEAGSASYTPLASYASNSTGGPITITRSGNGAYAVRFVGLGRADGQRENVQVTSYLEMSYCGIGSWQTVGADLVVNVLCFSPAGMAMDSRYTVLVTGARTLASRTGFALADQPSAISYRPTSRHSSASGDVAIARSAAGTYQVSFANLSRGPGSGPETVMVTQVGSGSNRCFVLNWNYSGFTANIRCTDRAGALTDAQFSILVMERGRAGQRTGFLWANEPASADYTPDNVYSHNSAGLVINARRTGPGVYQVSWDGLIKGPGTETVLVTAYGAADRFCRTSFWGMASATTFQVTVACFDPTGAPADSRFDVITVQ
jgi:hypothetical protein